MLKKTISLFLVVLLLIGMIPMAAFAEQEQSAPAPTRQKMVNEIEMYPNIPTPNEIIDWEQRAKDYDEFVFDWNPTDGRKYQTIFEDKTNNTFKIPPYYGDDRIAPDGSQDSLSSFGAVVGASLVGIDKSDQDGHNYVEQLLAYYWDEYGLVGPNVNFGEGAWQTHWYTLFSNVLFYQLADLYPDWDVDDKLISIAEKVYEMVVVLGGENADFNHQGFNFDTMEPYDLTWKEPDAAAAAAAILYWAYQKFGDEKYLQGAIWSMDYLARTEINPYYEILLNEAGYIAAQLNAFHGTNYDITKFMRWQLAEKTTVRQWGTAKTNWYGYDMAGVAAAYDTNDNGYAFAMNTFYPASTYVPMVRYDQSYARAVGKWVLNIANNARYFYADQWDEEHQTYPEFIDDPANVIAYEGFRKKHNGVEMVASGDPSVYRELWGLSEDCTDLGLYGSGFVGFLGAVVNKTNQDNILQLDCNATDFYNDESYPTYLYYNPYDTAKTVEIKLDDYSDLFDAVTGKMLATNVIGNVEFVVNADDVRVLVVAPANSEITYENGNTYLNDVFAAHQSSEQTIYEQTKLDVENADFSDGLDYWQVDGEIKLENVASMDGNSGFLAVQLKIDESSPTAPHVGDKLFMEFDGYIDGVLISSENPFIKITNTADAYQDILRINNSEVQDQERGVLTTTSAKPVNSDTVTDGVIPEGVPAIWCYVYNYNASDAYVDVKEVRIWGERDGQKVEYDYPALIDSSGQISSSWVTRSAISRQLVHLMPGTTLTREISVGSGLDQPGIGEMISTEADLYLSKECIFDSGDKVFEITQDGKTISSIENPFINTMTWRTLSAQSFQAIESEEPLRITISNPTDGIIRFDGINMTKLNKYEDVVKIPYAISNMDFEEGIAGWSQSNAAVEPFRQLEAGEALEFTLALGAEDDMPQAGDKLSLTVEAYLEEGISSADGGAAFVTIGTVDGDGEKTTLVSQTCSEELARGRLSQTVLTAAEVIGADAESIWVRIENANEGKKIDIKSVALTADRSGESISYAGFVNPIAKDLPSGWTGEGAEYRTAAILSPGGQLWRAVYTDIPNDQPHVGDKVVIETEAYFGSGHGASDAGNTFIARAYDSDGATYNYVMADVDKVDTSMKDPGQWQTYYSTTYGTGMIWETSKYFTVQLYNPTDMPLRLDEVNIFGLRGILSMAEPDVFNLKQLIGQAETLHETDYTKESYAQLVSVLEQAKIIGNYEYATEQQISEQEISLTNAMAALVALKADKTALEAAVRVAAALNEMDFTPESWKPFDASLKAAQELLASDTALISQVEKAVKDLTEYQNGLRYAEVDWTDFDGLLAEAKACAAEDYTPESYAVLEQAVKEAELLRTEKDVRVSEVYTMILALEKALLQLERYPVTRGDLQTLIESAKALDLEQYRKQGAEAVRQALEAAIQVVDADTTGPDEWKEAYDQLKSALAALVKLADLTDLKELMAQADALNEKDYTPESYKKVVEAYAQAQKVVESAEPSEEEAQAAYDALKAAIDGLEAVKEQPNTGDSPVFFMLVVAMCISGVVVLASRRKVIIDQ